ncbi:YdeI/OmpD-associated family protein [Streptomyces sp. NA04227]|uniref:YdeI/OmpD-associated family protein n=1 Tax=Streptomyces sp. NA04227 TaxID=2742136 RepID=UPI001590641E|nr:YdeI/OmpD-associated family protein [Streptomyces sp. NA04227]QKW05101.1 YdeI/OmpD-associated family protein [Streptomyces sp. NA04227]
MAGSSSAQDPVLGFAAQQDWEEWLAQNHTGVPGVWLRIPKKESGLEGVDYATALESALCYGWIDGQKKKLDEQHWLQRFTPRRSGSKWSKVNRDKATRLIEEGRMRAPGLAEVDGAKADGRWAAAYASQSKATVPDDLQAALDAAPAAREFFGTLDSRNRYAVLYRIQDAKKAETRAARIEKYVAMLAEGGKIHP